MSAVQPTADASLWEQRQVEAAAAVVVAAATAAAVESYEIQAKSTVVCVCVYSAVKEEPARCEAATEID